jgi:hypothetical protein
MTSTATPTRNPKKLKHHQIVLIHEAVAIAPKQSARKLRRNLCQSKSSPDKYKHMPPSILRCIKGRVKSARDQLTEQQLDTSSIPESLGDIIEWCKEHEFYAALKRHDDPNDPYCMPLYEAFDFGTDIKPEYQVIHITSPTSGSS